MARGGWDDALLASLLGGLPCVIVVSNGGWFWAAPTPLSTLPIPYATVFVVASCHAFLLVLAERAVAAAAWLGPHVAIVEVQLVSCRYFTPCEEHQSVYEGSIWLCVFYESEFAVRVAAVVYVSGPVSVEVAVHIDSRASQLYPVFRCWFGERCFPYVLSQGGSFWDGVCGEGSVAFISRFSHDTSPRVCVVIAEACEVLILAGVDSHFPLALVLTLAVGVRV